MQFLSIHDGVARPLDAAPGSLAPGELLWIDCRYEEARAWVADAQRLTGTFVFEDHLLDAENPAHPSYFDSTQDYELIVFRGLALHSPGEERAEDEGPTRVRTRPTVFFLLPGCLVTVRAPDSRTVPALRERLINSAPGRQRLPDSPEALMLRLLNSMVDRYLELRQPLTSQLERWQRRLLDPRRPFRDWYLLLEARGELRKLEQLCEEQLDALQEWLDERLELAPQENGQLAASAPGPLSDALQVRANDVVSHIQRVHAHARRLQDSLESAIQLHFSSTAHRTNEIMRTLTTITAIFMPLTLITGIFGMNFEFIPGLHARAGFWIALAAMGAIALLLVAVFRARRYLSASSTRRRARTAKPRQGGTEKPRDGESAKPRGA